MASHHTGNEQLQQVDNYKDNKMIRFELELIV